jgi:hypothetical protein
LFCEEKRKKIIEINIFKKKEEEDTLNKGKIENNGRLHT